jgi:hypothetical protein
VSDDRNSSYSQLSNGKVGLYRRGTGKDGGDASTGLTQLRETLSKTLAPFPECDKIGLLLQRLGIELFRSSTLKVSELLLHLSA